MVRTIDTQKVSSDVVTVTTKKVKKPRVAYPIPEGGLKAVPKDWNRKIHKPLKKRDFADETIYLEMRAKNLTAKAEKLRHEAKVIAAIPGNAEQRKIIRRVGRLLGRATALSIQLKEASGIDAIAFLTSLNNA
jgi:hypothetical protein